MLGYGAEELRGMTNHDFVAHGREDMDRAVGRKARGEGNACSEREYRRKDGTLLDVEGTVISYGGKEVVELPRLGPEPRAGPECPARFIERITPREREMLQALAEGFSDREISENLHVGIGTVRNHLVSIFGKLGVNSRLQALVFALRHGVVEIG